MIHQNIDFLPWVVDLIMLICIVAMLLSMIGSYLEEKAEENKHD